MKNETLQRHLCINFENFIIHQFFVDISIAIDIIDYNNMYLY